MKDVHHFPNNILRAATAIGLSDERFKMVSPARWRGVLAGAMSKFSDSRTVSTRWLWDNLIPPTTSLHVKDGPERILKLMGGNSRVWFVAEDWCNTKEEGNLWAFEGDLDAVVRVLGELHAFEYAVIDRKLEWLICENHHDVLIGAGESAMSRLACESEKLSRPTRG